MVIGCRRWLLVRLLVGRGRVNGDIGFFEGGNLVATGFLGIGFVRRPIAQMQMQRVGPWLTRIPCRANVIRGDAGVLISAINTPFQIAAPCALFTSCT